MHLAVTLRNMGHQSDAATMLGGARHAEDLGFESVWITDHIAIPPDDAEGSGGRYTDPLTTLAWLGGATQRIGLGLGVLVAPYRAALPTAKAVATVHELTGERLILGVAPGWMDAEFRALGVPRSERGRRTDELLELMREGFADGVAERNGQAFLFKPQPPAPPIYIGGAAPHALKRAVRFGHGWLPMSRNLDKLRADISQFEQLAADAGKTRGPVSVMSGLPTNDPIEAREQLARIKDIGVDRLVCAQRYESLDQYRAQLDELAVLL